MELLHHIFGALFVENNHFKSVFSIIAADSVKFYEINLCEFVAIKSLTELASLFFWTAQTLIFQLVHFFVQRSKNSSKKTILPFYYFFFILFFDKTPPCGYEIIIHHWCIYVLTVYSRSIFQQNLSNPCTYRTFTVSVCLRTCVLLPSNHLFIILYCTIVTIAWYRFYLFHFFLPLFSLTFCWCTFWHFHFIFMLYIVSLSADFAFTDCDRTVSLCVCIRCPSTTMCT